MHIIIILKNAPLSNKCVVSPAWGQESNPAGDQCFLFQKFFLNFDPEKIFLDCENNFRIFGVI